MPLKHDELPEVGVHCRWGAPPPVQTMHSMGELPPLQLAQLDTQVEPQRMHPASAEPDDEPLDEPLPEPLPDDEPDDDEAVPSWLPLPPSPPSPPPLADASRPSNVLKSMVHATGPANAHATASAKEADARPMCAFYHAVPRAAAGARALRRRSARPTITV